MPLHFEGLKVALPVQQTWNSVSNNELYLLGMNDVKLLMLVRYRHSSSMVTAVLALPRSAHMAVDLL